MHTVFLQALYLNLIAALCVLVCRGEQFRSHTNGDGSFASFFLKHLKIAEA